MNTPSRGWKSTSPLNSGVQLTPSMWCFLLRQRNIFLLKHDPKRWPRILYKAGYTEESKRERNVLIHSERKISEVSAMRSPGSVPLPSLFLLELCSRCSRTNY